VWGRSRVYPLSVLDFKVEGSVEVAWSSGPTETGPLRPKNLCGETKPCIALEHATVLFS
jgi:hypothetical protein